MPPATAYDHQRDEHQRAVDDAVKELGGSVTIPRQYAIEMARLRREKDALTVTEPAA